MIILPVSGCLEETKWSVHKSRTMPPSNIKSKIYWLAQWEWIAISILVFYLLNMHTSEHQLWPHPSRPAWTGTMNPGHLHWASEESSLCLMEQQLYHMLSLLHRVGCRCRSYFLVFLKWDYQHKLPMVALIM